MTDSLPLTPAFIEWFWQRVDKSGDCWLWTGTKRQSGYGGLEIAGRAYRAHRVSWVIANGPIPDGLLVCHHCDNPPCVRPDHLFLGTDADNLADRIRKGRGLVPPKLTPETVRDIRQRAGSESLRALGREYGVSDFAIRDVVKGRTWRHVA